MAFPYPLTRKGYNSVINNTFPPIQQRALRNLFDREIAVKDATLARVNSTLLVDPDLSCDVLADVPYDVRASLFITTGAVGSFQFNLNGGTAVASLVRGKSSFVTGAGAATVVIDAAALNTAYNPAAAAYVYAEFRGTILFSSSGTLAINWAQSVTNATAGQLLSLSSLSVEPMTSLYGK